MMQDKKFKRKKEDFICQHCGTKVKGTGYTDHCPKCLWSKHIDINPGDRKSLCKGMMEPQEIEIKGDDYLIYYKCEKCGYQHRVKSSTEDNFEDILDLSRN